MILEALRNSGVNLTFEDAKKFAIALALEIKCDCPAIGETYFDCEMDRMIEHLQEEKLL